MLLFRRKSDNLPKPEEIPVGFDEHDEDSDVRRPLTGGGGATGAPPVTRCGLTAEEAVKMSLAVLCIGGICTTWVGMAHIGQYLQENGFEKPYFMAWFVHSAYLWFFLLVLLVRCLVMRGGPRWGTARVSATLNLSSSSSLLVSPSRFSLLQYVKTGLVVAVVVFFMLYLWYLSLPKTSVAVNTSIYQSSAIIVYVLSVFLFRESVGLIKVVSVVVCLLGVFLISFGDQAAGGEGGGGGGDVAGYLFLAGSTVLYAFYEVIYRYMGVDASDTKTEAFYHALLVLGFVGVFTLLIFWPGVVILHFTGKEVLDWPPASGLVPLMVCLMALCESLFNLCLLTGIFLTSPLFISVGSMLAIPVAIVTDHLLGKLTLTSMAYSGIACVVAGFCGLNFAEWRHQKQAVSAQAHE